MLGQDYLIEVLHLQTAQDFSEFLQRSLTHFSTYTLKNFGDYVGIVLDPRTIALYPKLCRYNLSEPINDRLIAPIKVFQSSLFLLLVSSGSHTYFMRKTPSFRSS